MAAASRPTRPLWPRGQGRWHRKWPTQRYASQQSACAGVFARAWRRPDDGGGGGDGVVGDSESGGCDGNEGVGDSGDGDHMGCGDVDRVILP